VVEYELVIKGIEELQIASEFGQTQKRFVMGRSVAGHERLVIAHALVEACRYLGRA
jgi:hypothetical protein